MVVMRLRRLLYVLFLLLSTRFEATAGSSSLCSDYPAPRVRQALDVIGEVNAVASSLTVDEVTDKIFDVEGVVVANYERTSLKGFFLQVPEGVSHQVVAGSSQSIFVSLTGFPEDVAEGDYLHVKGRLTIRGSLPTILPTQLETVCGNSFNPNANPFCPSLCAKVAVKQVNLPIDASKGKELIGMLIHIVDELTVVDTFDVVHGKLGLSTAGRLFNPASVFSVESAEFDDLAAENSINLISLVDPFVGACGVGNSWVESLNLGIGSVLESRTLESSMVLIPSFGEDGEIDSDSLQLTVTFQGSKKLSANFDSPEVDLNIGLPSNNLLETVKIATFNIENFFLTLQEDDSCGDCRGADTSAEFERQRIKVVNALLGTDAAVIGLQELENRVDDSVLEFVVGELNSASGLDQFSFIPTGNSGSDVIRNGILYRSDIVSPIALQFFEIEHSKDSSGNQKSRPTLFQRFKVNGCAIDFLFGVSHLKSKGSSCETDPEGSLEGESNCGGLRLDHVQEILNFLDSNNFSPDTDNIFLVGDFNSYSGERSMQLLVDAGFSQLFSPQSSYTTSFRGEVGALDHIFMSQPLIGTCDSGLEWHINSDQMTLKDYDIDFGDECTSKPDAFFQPSPLRSSDHDPVIIVCNFKQKCISSTIHLGIVEVNSDSSSIKLVVLSNVPNEQEQIFTVVTHANESTEFIWRFSSVVAGTVVTFNLDSMEASVGQIIGARSSFRLGDVALVEFKNSALFGFRASDNFNDLVASGKYNSGIDAISFSEESPQVLSYSGITQGTVKDIKLNLFDAAKFDKESEFEDEVTLITETPTVSPTNSPTFSPTSFPSVPSNEISEPTSSPEVSPSSSPSAGLPEEENEIDSGLSIGATIFFCLLVAGLVAVFGFGVCKNHIDIADNFTFQEITPIKQEHVMPAEPRKPSERNSQVTTQNPLFDPVEEA